LRDLGGIIVIDFIDMLDYKHRFNIENRLAKRMQGDKSRIKISSITENGTLELTRQRLKQSHRLISHISCKKCQGTGRIRDIKGLGVVALREIVFYLNINSSLLDILNIELPMNIANFLNNEKRKELLNFGSEFKLKINIIGNSTFSDYNIKFKEIKNK
jgi:ribonuclease E